jgi:hypothetical protein
MQVGDAVLIGISRLSDRRAELAAILGVGGGEDAHHLVGSSIEKIDPAGHVFSF